MNKRQRIPKGQSKRDNPEKLGTYGTQEKQNKHSTHYVWDTTVRKLYLQTFFRINTTDATSGAGTAYPSRAQVYRK